MPQIVVAGVVFEAIACIRTSITTMTLAGPCEKDSDCQDNAGCFDDPTNKSVKTCHCFLGYLLDKTTASFPKTGTCENLRTRSCTGDISKDYCITNTEGWGVCPYCRVWTLYKSFIKE